MKKMLLTTAAAAISVVAMAAAPSPRANKLQQDATPFRFMHLAQSQTANDGTIGASLDDARGNKTQREQELTPQVFPSGQRTGYIDGPDGSSWYYTCVFDVEKIEQDYYVEERIKGFKYTIYNEALEVVGTIEDTIELKEGETKVAGVELGSQVTAKFFNVDSNFEVMVCVSTNTAEFVNHNVTRVYSIGNNTPLMEIPGYYVYAVNTATDDSERFWITFVNEEETQTPEINGVLNSADYVFSVYKNAGYGGLEEPKFQARVPMILSAGENSLPFLCRSYKGKPWFATAMLKYCYYENPYDFENENVTPNNELQVRLYTVGEGYNPPVEPYSMTTFPSEATVENTQFLYLGTFLYDEDISFGHYTSDDNPSLIISTEKYVTETDGYIYDFDVYTTAPKGEEAQGQHLLNLAKNTEGGFFLDDIRGYDPQVMFIKNNGSNYYFEFTNLYSGEVEANLPQELDGTNITMTAQTQRVPNKDGYLYATSQTHGDVDEEGNVLHCVAYITPEGEVDHIDRINLGQDIANAQVYVGSNAFNPYVFNLDENMEYMVLVKRNDSPGSTKLHEELLITRANTPYDPIMLLGPDENYGDLATIWLSNIGTATPALAVVYGKDFIYTTTTYKLPFEYFTEGDGTAENPYQITTLGGFEQIKNFPNSHFVLKNDIDARGYTLTNTNFDFTGSFDGQGHTISNLAVKGHAIFPQVMKSGETGGVIANLNLVDVEFEPTIVTQGIVADMVVGGTLSNIHIYNAEVETDSEMVLGGIAGSTSLNSVIEGCYVTGADFEAPNAQVGGILGQTRTGSIVKACAFSGKIEGGEVVGGIVGDMGSIDDRISACHVNADLKARNTIGGIAGSSSRGLISNCHIEGKLEATDAPRWGGGPKTGGVVGTLAALYEDETSTEPVTPEPVIKGNYVNLTAMNSFENTAPEEYEGQNDSMHRIVGWTGFNESPDIIDYDQDGNPIYGERTVTEEGLFDNYAVSTLEAVNGTSDDANSVEGKSIDASEANMEFFTNLGFAYGSEIDAPWSFTGNPNKPSLFFEGGVFVFENLRETVGLDETKDIVLNFKGAELTEDLLGGFSMEVSDESVISVDNMAPGENSSIILTVRGLKEGKTVIRASVGLTAAECEITVSNTNSIAAVEIEGPAISYNGNEIKAQGCAIELYSIAGVRMAAGRDIVGTASLQSGIYIVNATDSEGVRRSMKIRVK